MNKNIIKSYAKNIKISDIYKFAEKENISISEREANLIHDSIHNDIDTLLSENALKLLKNKKNEINPLLYEKLLSYYYKYEKFIH